MSRDTSPDTADDGRNLSQTALAAITVCAIVLAASLLPAIAGSAPFSGVGPGAGAPGGAGGAGAQGGGFLSELLGGNDQQQNADQPLDDSQLNNDGSSPSDQGQAGDQSQSSQGQDSPSDSNTPPSEQAGDSTIDSQTRAPSNTNINSLSSPSDSYKIGGVSPVNGGEGYSNQSATRLFTVNTNQPDYYRTSAYSTYTGTGWERDTDEQTYRGTVPSEGRTIRDEQVVQYITLHVDSNTIPTVWRPNEVSADTQSEVLVTDQATFSTKDRLEKGTQFQVISYKPPNDPDRLRSAGTDYPAEVEEKYTQLPSDVPQRVHDRTDAVTSDADNPYEKAVAIEQHLEQKPYSLNASHEEGEPVADQFLFEMEKGYCQYYATTMVVMLRSEEVPARYVTGYSPGVQSDNNEYTVTSSNAHAWVEVYFPNTGWVRFDPTPAADRQEADQRTFNRAAQENGENSSAQPRQANVPGSPGEESFNDAAEPPYDVSLNQSAVPGADVTVTVSKAGSPVEGAVVTFNGEQVGTTDVSGEVVATVPYVEELVVNATMPDGTTRTADSLSAPPTLGSSDVFYSVPALDERLFAQSDETDSENETASETYSVSSNVTITAESSPAPGEDVPLRVTVEDVPMREASVSISGETAGTTNESGMIVVSIPDDADGTIPVTAERGEISGTTNLTVSTLEIGVEPAGRLPLLLPGQEATVTVTAGETTVQDARVSVDGQLIGQTDADGTTTVVLPLADTADISAATGAQTTTTTVSDLYWNLLLVLAGATALVAGLSAVAYYYGITPRRVIRWVRRWVSFLARQAVATVFALATRLEAFGWWLLGLGPRAFFRLQKVPGMVYERLSRLAVLLNPARLGRRAIAWVRWKLRRLYRRLFGDEDDLSAQPGSGTAGSSAAAGAPPTLRELWAEFLRIVRPPKVNTKTPGEIARYARSSGLPDRPVTIITDAFRDAEYGPDETPESRIERVRNAVSMLDSSDPSATEEESSSTAQPSGGDD